ncbi:OTU-domain-containing protein [Choiromyces venosus 120613-1]|uniref:Ubiquitin thioesterase OTU n=1 Tax=Choiromyces venosus 120613-1 TaxID=1336337 RepID=A0A3N4JKY1_9PEZI|nr:OTU-domain-containing protein [Choiromyces venosus 120613-1]
MRIKIRAPSGSQVLPLSPETTISSLLSEIRSKTSLSGDLEIKYGYPPKSLHLSEYPSSTLLKNLPIKLEGEQLIISESGEGGGGGGGSVATSSSAPFSFSGGAQGSSSQPDAPLTLNRSLKPKINKDDPPDVPLKSGRGTMVLRVMEDDNSCLFSAISYVATGSLYSVAELRQLIAATIQENPDTYSDAVLEQKRDGYCEWIQMESSWGGGIELGIFANFFDLEICTIDVSTNEVIRFNEGKTNRAIVVYSGIHYDAIVLSPAGSRTNDPSKDKRIFSSSDDEELEGALELCRELKKRKYFTDTKSFSLKCNICKTGLKGEKAAVVHAKSTGHKDFGEY